eukprot:6477736-Amphidinium_carterae.1
MQNALPEAMSPLGPSISRCRGNLHGLGGASELRVSHLVKSLGVRCDPRKPLERECFEGLLPFQEVTTVVPEQTWICEACSA